MKTNLFRGKFGLSILTILCSVLMAMPLYAQEKINVKGLVVDDNQEALIGVNVRIKGTTQGVATDLDGKFTLSGVPSNASLEFSYVGMKKSVVALKGQTFVKVVMQSSATSLDDVVVVAYGRQKKANLIGAVSSLDSKALKSRPVQNVGQALQGLVPGLNLSINKGGGALGSKMSMNIRGAGTIGAGSNSSPLVLIDGVEGDINALSPNDIESISVLKDAASSSIYGSRAAFGVILVTTKSGKNGKARINYSGSVRFSTATQLPDMMNSVRFAKYFNKANTNAGQTPFFKDDVIKKIEDFANGTIDPSIEGAKTGTFWKASDHKWAHYGEGNFANTDWFEEMYDKNVPAHEHNLSVSGGTEKMNYYISGSFLNKRGLIHYGKDSFDRYNMTAKISAEVLPWLDITYNTKWIRENYDRPSYMDANNLFFHNIARRWPVNAVRDNNGFLAPDMETIQMRDGGVSKTEKDFLYQSLNFVIKPIKSVNIHLENSYNTTNSNKHSNILPSYAHDDKGNPYPVVRAWGYPKEYSDVSESSWKNNYYSGRYFADYAQTFAEKHDVKVLAGMDIEINKWRYIDGTKKDLITPNIPTINTATNDKPTLNGGYNHWATAGFFARLNYAYDSRYLFEASIRRNGSSRFIDDKTWAVFPAFSLGWNVANEKFWEPIKEYVGQFKLRGSWGSLGNTNIEALYPWSQSLPIAVASSTSGSQWLIDNEHETITNAPRLVSSTLTWERVENLNFGLDLAAFDNRLQANFDYYIRTTKDMVGPPPPISSILGTAQPQANNSDLKSYGWELELSWRDAIGDFKYGTKFVLSDYQVEITKFYNPTNSLGVSWYEGRKMGEIWGYESVGLAKTDEEMTEHLKKNKPAWGSNWAAGDVMYKDLNGDGIVSQGKNTLEDHGDKKIIGNSTPRYSYSFSADAQWKGFDFSILLQGVGKRDWWDDSVYSFGASGANIWQAAAFDEHWDFFRPEGDPLGANVNGYFPRPLFEAGGKNLAVQTRYLQDASYLRIKNMQFGYTLPANLVNQIGLSNVRLFASVDNLVTFTKISKIFDPEVIDGAGSSSGLDSAGKIYPLQRTFSFGINVNL